MARRPNLPEYDKRLVGERILLLRQAKSWQQKALAEMIGEGLTPQKLNNYEKGRDLIPVHFAARLAVLTGAGFDYIYRGLMGNLPGDLAERVARLQHPPPAPSRRRPR
jgi:transcriptional regulator with XRE-family HTH domain